MSEVPPWSSFSVLTFSSGAEKEAAGAKEVALYGEALGGCLAGSDRLGCLLQGNLADKKLHPPRTLQ